MRNLLALVGLAVVVFVGGGWYFNWYTVKLQAGTDGKLNVSADVDKRKIGQDVGTFTEKAGQFISAHTKTEPSAPAGKAEFVGPPAPADWKPAGH